MDSKTWLTGALVLLLTVSLGFFGVVSALPPPLKAFIGEVVETRGKWVWWHYYYEWHAYGTYGDGVFEWHEPYGVSRLCRLTGIPNIAYAEGFVETPTESWSFKFNTPEKPYKWCYVNWKGHSVLWGDFYVNDELIGFCVFDNYDDKMIPVAGDCVKGD